MRWASLSQIAMMLSLLSITACNSIFVYGPPSLSTYPEGKIQTARDAANTAGEYATGYESRVTWLSSTPQMFEVPIIGTAIAGAFELAYGRAHKGPATTLLLTGAGLAAYESYYAPRSRVPIAQSGADAMRCIQAVALGVTIFDTTTPTEKSSASTLLEGMTQKTSLRELASEASPLAGLAFKTLADNADTTVAQLREAIRQINSKITSRNNATSVQPDTAAIAANLKKAIQQSSTQQAQVEAALKEIYKDDPSKASRVLASAPVQKAATLPADVAACVAQAG